MKYLGSWFERPRGSPIEYENAQKRILEIFGQWRAPRQSLTIHEIRKPLTPRE